jgi:hypothetical protein
MATIGDGIVAFAIAFAFVGFFWSLTTLDNSQTDYEICINKCPSNDWNGDFADLECPNMCENLIKGANCTKDDEVKG